MNYLRGLLLFALLFNKQYTSAQRYPTRTYTLRDGLPQMQIMTQLTDSRGYLWLGTKNGLAKFDGEQFEVYTRCDLGLESGHIVSLTEDRHHHLWIATAMGLIRFNGATFTPFPFPDSMARSSVQIQADDTGVWVHIYKDAAYKLFRLEGGQFRNVASFVPGFRGLSPVNIQ